MAGIGADIKEVYEEIGTAVTVLRDVGNVSGEYIDFELNRQVTKPFIREFFVEAFLPYDSEIENGDVVEFDVTGDRYLVMNRTPELVENEVIQYQSVFYKCNVSGELLRPSGEWGDDYHMSQEWETLKTNCYGLMVEALFGHDLSTDEELGELGLEVNELYLPLSAGAEVNDRYIPVSGEYHRIETVKKRRFPAVVTIDLGDDVR